MGYDAVLPRGSRGIPKRFFSPSLRLPRGNRAKTIKLRRKDSTKRDLKAFIPINIKFPHAMLQCACVELQKKKCGAIAQLQQFCFGERKSKSETQYNTNVSFIQICGNTKKSVAPKVSLSCCSKILTPVNNDESPPCVARYVESAPNLLECGVKRLDIASVNH